MLSEMLAAAKAALELLESADWDNPVTPVWAHPSSIGPSPAVRDYLQVDQEKAEAVKRKLNEFGKVPGVQRDQVFPYVAATIGFDGYCHKGRSFSSVNQLKLLIKDLEEALSGEATK